MDSYKEALVALRRIIRATDLHSKQLVKKVNLTMSQLLVLQSIEEQGLTSSSQLAVAISLSKATITTIVDRLEERGLLYRKRNMEDKRKFILELSDQGREALKQAPKPLQEHFIQRFGQLESWEQTAIISALQRVASMMDASGIDASPVLDVGNLDRKTDK